MDTVNKITVDTAEKMIKSSLVFWEMLEIQTSRQATHDGMRLIRNGFFRRTTDGTFWRVTWIESEEGELETIPTDINHLVAIRQVRQIITSRWEEV